MATERCPARSCTAAGTIAVVLAAAPIPTATARARQDEGPIIVGVEKEWETIHFEPIRFTLDLVGRHERERIENSDGTTTTDVETILRQALTLSTTGHIGHPNLISLELAGTFGIEEQFIDDESTGRDEDPIETVNEYNVSALILRQSKLPTTLYSRRSQTTIDRQFGNSLDSVVTEHGAAAVLRSEVIPSSFQFFHREEEQDDRFDQSDFNLVQDTFAWQGQFKAEANQTLNWDYTFDDISESGELRATNSFQRHNLVATHLVDFGAQNEHSFRSTLLGFSESGNFPLDRIRLDEDLRLRHTPRLESLYNYSFDYQERPESDQSLHRGSVGVRHRLFESLISSANIGASHLEIDPDNFTSQQVFGDVNFDYRKKVPLGLLTAGLFAAVVVQDDSEQGEPIAIDNETHVFGTSGFIFLNRRNINPNSIRVTDATGTIIYTEGVDYTVRVFGDQVEIRRILGGDIGPSQVVLVDYVVDPLPANTTTTVGVGGTLRYDFEESFLNGLGLYVRYFNQEQDIDVVGPGMLEPADVDDFTYGADYRFWYVTLSAERQMRDSTLSPYEATRLNANYTQPLGLGSSLAFNASYDEIDRTDENTRSKIAMVGGKWTQQLTNHFSLSLAALWRNEEDTAGFSVQGWEQHLDATWRYRQTTVYGSFRNSILDGDRTDSSFQSFMLGLRREF